VAGITATAGHRGMTHRVGREARSGVGVAVAALDGARRNVRGRRLAGRGSAVMAARAVGVGGRMDEGGAGEACRALMAGRAILTVGGDVAGERSGALRARGALARI